MNYSYPIPGSQADPTAFVANMAGVLGSYDKPVDAKTHLSVDYTQLVTAPTISSYSYLISPGGEPQLQIYGSQLTANVLMFAVQGGIGGRTYTVTINAKQSNGETRSDTLTINVLGDDSQSCQIVNPPLINNLTSADGMMVVNTAPRFFVSATAPINGQAFDQWYNTSTGVLYFCISDGNTFFWRPN